VVIALALVLAVLQVAVPFTTLAHGRDSQIVEPRQVAVRSAADWQRVWSAHGGDDAPAVDFARAMVVGVFLGERPTSGHAVEITAVRSANGSIVAEYVERAPPRGAPVAQVVTAPFHVVTMPRSTAAVEFRKVVR
jgi:hypothetical protein